MNEQDMSWFVRRFMEPETLTSDEMERFCKLAAARAVAAEREACARIAKSYGGPDEPMMVGTYEAGWFNAAEAIAADIRARGEK